MRIALAVALSLAAAGAVAQSPYAGQEARTVKALSPEDVEALLAGRGHGFAKAAELNGWPGPLHVLEHAAELRLAEDQRRQVQAVFDRMQAEARRLGADVVERERRLDRRFAHRHIDPATVAAESEAIGAAMGRLRAVHLAAHLETSALLTPEQVERYNALRGYAGPAAGAVGSDGHGHRRH